NGSIDRSPAILLCGLVPAIAANRMGAAVTRLHSLARGHSQSRQQRNNSTECRYACISPRWNDRLAYQAGLTQISTNSDFRTASMRNPVADVSVPGPKPPNKAAGPDVKPAASPVSASFL